MNSYNSRDITPYRQLEIKVSEHVAYIIMVEEQAEHESNSKESSGFLLGIFFDSNYVGDVILQTVL
jgi:hypothetical protein